MKRNLSDFGLEIYEQGFSWMLTQFEYELTLLIQILITMGNNPNQLIQCGYADKDLKKQVETTKQYALKYQRLEQYSDKVSSANDSHEGSTSLSSMPIKNTNFIPQHESLTMVSPVPLPNFVKSQEGNFHVEEDIGICLDEIIQSRYNTTMHFPEPQMIALLESLVYGLAYLSNKDIPHHDFYPTNIFYKDSRFRIVNPMITQCSGYSITQQRKRFSFLSPELIIEVLNDTKEVNISKEIMEKSDIFAIGMIMLEFSTLQPSSQCYDAQTYNIIDSVVQERVNKCSQIYNPLLSQCIDLMLQYQVNKRIPPKQLSYAVHSTISNIKKASNPPVIPQNRVPTGGRVSSHQPMPQQMHPTALVQTRLPNGQVILGPPPQMVEGSPKGYVLQQNVPYFGGKQPMKTEEGKVKLNPFQQIQEEEGEDSRKQEFQVEKVEKDESLEERVKRILQASRTIK